MDTYQKIDSLYRFDEKTKTYTKDFYGAEVGFLANCPWYVTEKINGTNIRVYWDGYRVTWGGRTDKAALPKEVENLLQATFGESEVIFEQHFGDKPVHLFMECYGGKIQGGLYGGVERLIGFDVKVGYTWLDKTVIKDIFDLFGIETVKVEKMPSLYYAINEVEAMVEFPKQHISSHCEKGTTTIEGLVAVPACRLLDAKGTRIIVKIKCDALRKLK